MVLILRFLTADHLVMAPVMTKS